MATDTNLPPVPSSDLAPGTLVRSPVFPDARGIYVGTSPAGVVWVAWRRDEAVAHVYGRVETWLEVVAKAARMAERLAQLETRKRAREARRN